MPCKKKITAEKTSHLFFQFVWVHFGLPTSILYDRDSCFLGNFWMSLWRMMDTKLKRSIEFHSQITEKINVFNRTKIHLLQGYCGKHP